MIVILDIIEQVFDTHIFKSMDIKQFIFGRNDNLLKCFINTFSLIYVIDYNENVRVVHLLL